MRSQQALFHRILCAVLLLSVLEVAWADDNQPVADEDKPGMFARIRERRLSWIGGTDAWAYAGVSGAFVNMQDTRMAPLIYDGFGAGASLAHIVDRQRWTWPTTIYAHFALPEGPQELPGTYQNIGADVDTVFLWRLGRRGGGSDGGFAVGGGLQGGTNLRVYDKLQNSSVNSDIIVSAAASAQWKIPFSIFGRSLAFHARLSAPLFSYVGRSPEYALHGLASYWLPPWSFMRVSVETGFTWRLRWSEENTARLLYTWDFYGMNELDGLHVLRIGTHTLGLGFGLKRM